MILVTVLAFNLLGDGLRDALDPEAQALKLDQAERMPLLEIEDLHVEFPTQGGVMHAVEGVSLTLDEGEVLGIVGESGSGKSVTMLALMGLSPTRAACARSGCASPATTCWASPTASAAAWSARTWR